jgi:hypothetical protein
MELPVVPGVYVEPADDDLWELGEDRQWRAVGRRLPFGGLKLDPAGPPVSAEEMVRNGVFPTERIEIPDYPPR